MKSTNYIPDLYAFLREVGARQDRQWFKENKSRYDDLRALWINDIDLLIRQCSEFWPELRSQTGATSVYRIYRDTRFSPDKTPYKTYFSATVNPYGRSSFGAHQPGYYIQAGPVSDKAPAAGEGAPFHGIYGGVWAPEAPVLKKLRKAIIDNIDEFNDIIHEPRLLELYPDWYGDRLKTVPKGYPKDHPYAHILRLKDYGRYLPLTEAFFCDPAWPEVAAEHLRVLYPLIAFLDYSIHE